jgi:sulfide:quinone oxidoreductase
MADSTAGANDRQTPDRFDVLIAGGGVAGLEAAFALRALAGERVALTLLAPNDEFVYRPLSFGEPFTSGRALRYPLAKLAAEAGVELLCDALVEVDVPRRLARTAGGAEIAYDALVVALGASLQPAYEHVTTVDDTRMDELLHGLVQDLEGGYVNRVAIVVPAPVPWPLPAYELALMLSERAWDMQVELAVTVLTPESSPLAVFGVETSRALSLLLSERHVDVLTSATCDVPRAKSVRVHPGDRTLEVDRVIALPRLKGPGLVGLPHDESGFIPIDEHGQVRGAERVWAAGDATDFPIKHGGVAAQLADTVARSIAALIGAASDPPPFAPVLDGVLLTGGTPRYLRARRTGGYAAEPAPTAEPAGAATTTAAVAAPAATPATEPKPALAEVPHGARAAKIAARYLAPHLVDDGSAPVTVPV